MERDAETIARQSTLTHAAKDRMHEAWHRYNGADAACSRCGTTRVPEWVRRAKSRSLVAKDMTEG